MTSLKFDNTLGAMLIGTALSTAVWGMACVQTYTYYFNNQDNRLQHAFVAFLMALNTLNSVMNIHMCYFYMVQNYGNPFSLLDQAWSLHFTSFVLTFMVFLIRTVFARRIYIFSGNNIMLTAWIVSLTTFCFVAGIVLVSKGSIHSMTFGVHQNLLYASLSCGLMADLSITGSLCWLLNSVKTGYRRNDSLVNTLIVYMMNTGLVVTLGFVAGITTLVVMPANMIFFCVFMVVPKLYANAYLVSLNARSRLRHTQSSLGASLSDPQYAVPVTSVDPPSWAGQKKVGSAIGDIVDSPDSSVFFRISVVQNEVEI